MEKRRNVSEVKCSSPDDATLDLEMAEVSACERCEQGGALRSCTICLRLSGELPEDIVMDGENLADVACDVCEDVVEGDMTPGDVVSCRVCWAVTEGPELGEGMSRLAEGLQGEVQEDVPEIVSRGVTGEDGVEETGE